MRLLWIASTRAGKVTISFGLLRDDTGIETKGTKVFDDDMTMKLTVIDSGVSTQIDSIAR